MHLARLSSLKFSGMRKLRLKVKKTKVLKPNTLEQKEELAADSKFFQDRVVIRLSSGTYVIEFAEIVHIEGDGGYSTFFLQDGRKMVVSKTLIRIERCLKNTFIRVHQSHIINLRHLKCLEKKDGYVLTMSDNSKIAVSMRRREEFMKKLENFNQF